MNDVLAMSETRGFRAMHDVRWGKWIRFKEEPRTDIFIRFLSLCAQWSVYIIATQPHHAEGYCGEIQ